LEAHFLWLVRIAEAGAGTASPEKLELSTLAKGGLQKLSLLQFPCYLSPASHRARGYHIHEQAKTRQV
jgi:hypothetical protein